MEGGIAAMNITSGTGRRGGRDGERGAEAGMEWRATWPSRPRGDVASSSADGPFHCARLRFRLRASICGARPCAVARCSLEPDTSDDRTPYPTKSYM